eukprot:gene13802-biopygen13409
MDGRNFFLDGRSSSVQGRYVQTGAPSVHLDGRSVVWTERFRARESGSVRPSSMDGRSARLDGALPRPRIGLRPSIVHPLRPDGAIQIQLRPNRLRPSRRSVRPMDAPSKTSSGRELRPGKTPSVRIRPPSVRWTLRPDQLRPNRRSVRPMDAPSRSAPSKPSLHPSNGRSVQISSVQAEAPSVQVDAPSKSAPSKSTLRPSKPRLRPSKAELRPSKPFFAPENSAPSVHRPWTDGALVWTERRLDGRSLDLDGADLDGASVGWTELTSTR